MAITFLNTIIIGVVEGLTEFIPVSSTAHILVSAHLLGIAQTPLLETLTISIQSGAVLALCVYFFKKIIQSNTLWWKIIIGFIPTAIAGFFLHPLLSMLYRSFHIIGYALILGGILFLFIQERNESPLPERNPTLKEFLLLGITQIVSIIPGVSRSGATLLLGSFFRIPKKVIVEASFLLAIPTILGATVLDIVKNPLPTGETLSILLVGITTAFFASLFSIHFFLQFLKEKPLSWFGWYRIGAGICILIFL